MLNSLRAMARFIQNKIGWNRIGVLLSVTIIAVAAVVLFRMLLEIDINEVYRALRATPLSHIAAAALFVAGGYFTLTFYDLFALRTLGRKDIPYRIAALAGFTSYSIGHNIGATVFTGGAVPHLFVLRARRRCCGEDLFSSGSQVLARQRHRARTWHRLSSGSRQRDQPAPDNA